MRHFFVCMSLFASPLLALAMPTFVTAATGVPDELLASLAQLEADYREVSATGRLVQKNTNKLSPGSLRTSEFEVSRSGKLLKLAITNNKETTEGNDDGALAKRLKESVMGVNENYRFRLERDSADRPFMMVDYGEPTQRSTTDLRNRTSPIVDFGFQLDARKTVDILRNPRTQIDEYRVAPDGEGQNLATVRFAIPSVPEAAKKDKRPTARLKTGKLTYWKDQKFLLKEYELRYAIESGFYTKEVLVEYQDRSMVQPVPRSVTVRTIDVPNGDIGKPVPVPGSRLVDETIYRYDTFKFGPLPESRFLLSYYNIPEMATSKVERSPLAKYLVIVSGSLFLIGAFAARILLKRRQTRLGAHGR